MSLQNITIDLPSQTAQDFKDICYLAPLANQAAINLSNFFRRLAGGESYGTVTANVGAVQATATMTVSAGGSGDGETCVVAGVTFTAKSSGATGNQFNVGADDEETATNLAAAINASVTALVTGVVTASASAEVVTVAAAQSGLVGNSIAIASADATITASGARLAGGAADASAITLSF